MNKYKKNDKVIVISGKDKGKIGVVKSSKDSYITVEGVNDSVKKHVKPNQTDKGGIINLTKPIHVSNIMHYDTESKSKSKISFIFKEAKKIRIYKKNKKQVAE